MTIGEFVTFAFLTGFGLLVIFTLMWWVVKTLMR